MCPGTCIGGQSVRPTRVFGFEMNFLAESGQARPSLNSIQHYTQLFLRFSGKPARGDEMNSA